MLLTISTIESVFRRWSLAVEILNRQHGDNRLDQKLAKLNQGSEGRCLGRAQEAYVIIFRVRRIKEVTSERFFCIHFWDPRVASITDLVRIRQTKCDSLNPNDGFISNRHYPPSTQSFQPLHTFTHPNRRSTAYSIDNILT